MPENAEDILKRFGEWCQKEIAREHRERPRIEGKLIKEKRLTPRERQQRRFLFLKTFLGLFYTDKPPEFQEKIKHALLSKSAEKGVKTKRKKQEIKRKNQEQERQGELDL